MYDISLKKIILPDIPHQLMKRILLFVVSLLCATSHMAQTNYGNFGSSKSLKISPILPRDQNVRYASQSYIAKLSTPDLATQMINELNS
jgi:hypothetical protein